MVHDWFEYRIVEWFEDECRVTEWVTTGLNTETEWFTDECRETEWVMTGLNTEKRNGSKMNAESRNG